MRNSLLAAARALVGAAARGEGGLRIAVYTEHAPFSDDGKCVDVDLGNALATKLGLPAEIIPFKDGDDLIVRLVAVDDPQSADRDGWYQQIAMGDRLFAEHTDVQRVAIPDHP